MKPRYCVAALLAILLLLPWAALAAPVGKVTSLQGNVDITVTGEVARNVALGDAVNVGDVIRTKSNSRVEITFSAGNILRLAANTRVRITEYMSGPKQNSSVLYLFRGTIEHIVKSIGPGGKYEVHTPTAVCGASEADWHNSYSPTEGTLTAVLSGTVTTTGLTGTIGPTQERVTVMVKAGQQVVLSSTSTVPPKVQTLSHQQIQQLQNAAGEPRQSSDFSGTGSLHFGTFTVAGTAETGAGVSGASGGGVFTPTPIANVTVILPTTKTKTDKKTTVITTNNNDSQTADTRNNNTPTTLDLNITPSDIFLGNKLHEGGEITGTTNDGGAYKGFLDTLYLPYQTKHLDTDVLALYADKSDHTGILRGNIQSIYEMDSGFKSEGDLNRIELATATDIEASKLVGSGITSIATEEGLTSSNLLYDKDPAYTLGPKRTQTHKTSTILKIKVYDNWLIGQADVIGTYIGDPTGDAVYFTYIANDGTSNTPGKIGANSAFVTQTDSSWTANRGGYFRGNVVKADVYWTSATPSTSVSGGTIKGTFYAASIGAWTSSALYTGIETSKFVDMAASGDGRAKLDKLNIPSVQVGTVTLTGNSGGNSVVIKDMNFYAPSSGAQPTVWASKNVTGVLGNVIAGTTSVPLRGGGLSADFLVLRMDSDKWGATIKKGLGGFKGTTAFGGGAAGTYNPGTKAIIGTASGMAYTAPKAH